MALAAGAIAVFMGVVVYGQLRELQHRLLDRLVGRGAGDRLDRALGVVMTVVPTLLLTRKYLKV